MNSRYILFIVFGFLFLIFIAACATIKPKKDKFDGFFGIVKPVNRDGEEIVYQERDKVIINCIPVKGEFTASDGPFTFNPEPDGNFVAKLHYGEYSVEIFLNGFYVESFYITIPKGELIDIGIVELKEITADEGEPVMGGDPDEIILHEGDVNIQPPSL
ncbi:MAG TPA: hypothetical protein ENI15_16995 [Spirochaetes bacterium]|nr:hypothetical protein [Spirochaetota bacterium]